MTLFGRTSLTVLLLGVAAWAKPEPKTTIMYYTPVLETKLSVAFKHRQYEWPVLRIGVASNGKRHFGMIRLHIKKDATRAGVARELVDCGRIAFAMDPHLEHADLDAVLADDTSKTKAEPMFALSLSRAQMAKYRATLVPEIWLKEQGVLTIKPSLKPDRDPAQIVCDQLLAIFTQASQRLPLAHKAAPAKPPKPKALAPKPKGPAQPE
jgi:hypothetical protein